MAKCANCDREALYLYQISDNFKQYFCQNHLPHFLWASRDAGVLGIPAEPVVEETPVTETKSKKKTVEPEPEVVPEVTTEEVPAEEAPSEA
jgi:hypothetical protein